MKKQTSTTKLIVAAPFFLLLLVVAVHYIVNMPPRGASQEFKKIYHYSKKIDREKTIQYPVAKNLPIEVHFYCYPECRLYPGNRKIPEPYFSQDTFFFRSFTIEAKKIVLWVGIARDVSLVDRKPWVDYREPTSDRVYRIDSSAIVSLSNITAAWKLNFVEKDHLVAVAAVPENGGLGFAFIKITPTQAPMNLEES